MWVHVWEREKERESKESLQFEWVDDDDDITVNIKNEKEIYVFTQILGYRQEKTIFKQSTVGLNPEFSFTEIGSHTWLK